MRLVGEATACVVHARRVRQARATLSTRSQRASTMNDYFQLSKRAVNLPDENDCSMV
jgi:hypothetical protein